MAKYISIPVKPDKISVRIPKAAKEELEGMARGHSLTVSDLTRIALTRFFTELEKYNKRRRDMMTIWDMLKM